MKIYILKLEHDKYYIGKTDKPIHRVMQHFSACGAEWTKCHKPIDILEMFSDCDEYDEDKYTKKYMAKYGVDNVRGGAYCNIKLMSEQKKMLTRELNHAKGACLFCGEHDHFIKDCPIKSIPKARAKGNESKSHSSDKQVNVDQNQGKTFTGRFIDFGRRILEYFGDDLSSEDEYEYCDRCGRKGHVYAECYAKRHIRGFKIR